MGAFEIGRSVAGKVSVAEVIGNDDEDVWFGLCFGNREQEK